MVGALRRVVVFWRGIAGVRCSWMRVSFVPRHESAHPPHVWLDGGPARIGRNNRAIDVA